MKLKKTLLILGTTGITFFTLNGSVGALTNSIEASVNKGVNNVGDSNNSVFKQISNGLPTTVKVNFTIQDNSNNVWTGTSSGLYESIDRGKTFSPVANQVFGGLQVLSMRQDAHSIYWVGTNQGLYRADAKGITFVLITSGFVDPKLVINFLYTDRSAWLYVGTSKGFYRKGIEGSNFVIVPSMNAANNVVSMAEAGNGVLWLSTSTRSGAYYATSPSGTGWRLRNNGSDGNIEHIFTDVIDGNYIWAVGNNGLEIKHIYYRNGGSGGVKYFVSHDLRVTSIIHTASNQFYIGTQKGIWSIGNGWQYTRLISRFPDVPVNQLFQDNSGSIYAGTVNRGLWLSLNKIYGYDILNRGKEIDIPRKNGGTDQYFNQDITLFSKNDFVNKVTINGVDIAKSGNWSKTLDGVQNKGAYQVVFHNINNATTTINIYITKSLTSDDFNYTSPNNNMYHFNAQYNWGSQNINYIFVRVNDAKRNDAVMFKFNEIIDTTSANTYYQKFLGFNKADGSLKVAPEKIPFTTDPKGIGNSYVLTLTNKLGASAKYFLQIANSYESPIMNKKSNVPDGGGKWLPSIPDSNKNKKNNLAAIIGGSIGGVVFLSLLVGTALYFKKRKDSLSKKNASERS